MRRHVLIALALVCSPAALMAQKSAVTATSAARSVGSTDSREGDIEAVDRMLAKGEI